MEKGAIDRIVHRNELRQEIADLLSMFQHKARPEGITDQVNDEPVVLKEPVEGEVPDELIEKEAESVDAIIGSEVPTSSELPLQTPNK